MRFSVILVATVCSMALAAPHGLDKRDTVALPDPPAEVPETEVSGTEKRDRNGTEYVGKRGRNGTEYVGKRGRNGTEYVGKRGRNGTEYVGKRGRNGTEYVGKRSDDDTE